MRVLPGQRVYGLQKSGAAAPLKAMRLFPNRVGNR
jgi:hypothetical protein